MAEARFVEMLIYTGRSGQPVIDVQTDGETVWLTQTQIAELFGTSKQNISLHIQNIFQESELSREATVKEYLIVQTEGNRKVSRNIEHYPKYLSRKQSIFQKIAESVEKFKGVGGQYRAGEISRGTLILRETARFHILPAGRFRSMFCDNCR